MFNQLQNWWKNLDENYKRIILSILFTLTVIIIGYLLYIVFFKAKPEPPSVGIPIDIVPGRLPGEDIADILRRQGIVIPPGAELPPEFRLPPSEGRPSTIADGGRTIAQPEVYTNAEHVNIYASGHIVYYNSSDGKFYTIDANGNIVLLSEKAFPNVEDVTWSPQDGKAILEFPDGSNIYYDFSTQQQRTLPPEGQDFDFSSTGNQIGYKFLTNNPDENWLLVSEPNGENTIAVEHIGEADPNDVEVNWSPDNTKVATFRKGASVEAQEVFFIGQNQENYKSLSITGRGFEGKWSPQGNRLLYNIFSPESGYRPELWVTNSADTNLGINNKSLAIKTWVEKCVWSQNNQNIYCAVPVYLEQGTGLYKQLAQDVPDILYKINTQTGFKEQIAIPTNSVGIGLYTVSQLMLSPDEKELHLVTMSNGIYKVQLVEK